MDYFWGLFISGLTKGSIYALIALGYSLVYGIIELINFAHGEIYMIGAFTSLIVVSLLLMEGMTGWGALLLSLIVAVIYAAAYGFTVEKIAYKPLRQASRLSPLISAVGMSIFLQNYVLLAQTPDFLPFPNLIPEISFLKRIFPLMTPAEIAILLTTACLMVVVTFIVKFTKMGMAMRAAAQDRMMALLLGVNVNRVISHAFILGSSLAAVAGVLIATHVGRVNFYMGFIAGLKAFTAAVLGGIGSIPGAVVGGLVLGWAESFGAGYISSDYEDAFAFFLLILILIVKPSGIMGRATQKM